MSYSYNKLWKLLIDRNLTKEDLRKLIKASPTTIAAMGRGEGISPKVLERICLMLQVQPSDIVEYVPSPNELPDEQIKQYIDDYFRNSVRFRHDEKITHTVKELLSIAKERMLYPDAELRRMISRCS